MTNSKDTVEVEVHWFEVDGSMDKAIELARSKPEVVALADGSDYTQQYYTIEVAAESMIFIFRKEPKD